MYRIETDIDTRFPNFSAARAAFMTGRDIKPSAPNKGDTPRIEVYPTIDDCINGTGLQPFHRCLAENPGAKRFDTKGLEIYPVILLHFRHSTHEYVIPDKTKSPNADQSGERWLMAPTAPDSACVIWLTPQSIICDKPNGGPTTFDVSTYKVDSVTFYTEDHFPKNRIHPWLTKTGHTLNSYEQEI